MTQTTRGVVLYPLHNTHGKRDSTGAFHPEAKRFAKLHGLELTGFDNRASKRARRAEVERTIWECPEEHFPLDVVALFCHGFRRGLQTGHTLGTAKDLATVIALRSAPDVRVALYACDAARDADRDREDDATLGRGGDGGFADELSDALARLGCTGGWVDAHTTAGHTSRNPNVRRFYTDRGTSADGQRLDGGDWIVPPRSPLWRRWSRALWSKDEPKDIRLRFPLMTVLQIRTALG